MEQVTTLQLPAASGTDVVVTPVTMTPDLIVGARVCLGAPQYGFVYQPITSVTATTFTVTILNPGPFQAGTAVCVSRSWVGLVTGTGALPIAKPSYLRLCGSTGSRSPGIPCSLPARTRISGSSPRPSERAPGRCGRR